MQRTKWTKYTDHSMTNWLPDGLTFDSVQIGAFFCRKPKRLAKRHGQIADTNSIRIWVWKKVIQFCECFGFLFPQGSTQQSTSNEQMRSRLQRRILSTPDRVRRASVSDQNNRISIVWLSCSQFIAPLLPLLLSIRLTRALARVQIYLLSILTRDDNESRLVCARVSRRYLIIQFHGANS